jgi:hypothetical protein
MLETQVTVVIPTLAETTRKNELKRCIESIRYSSKNKVEIIVVVNGDRFGAGVCDWLKDQKDIRVEYVEKASAPNAVFHGRKLVNTPFFSTLDDDDEYLEGSTDTKLKILQEDSSIDFVITNGYRRLGGQDFLLYSDMDAIASYPLKSLFVSNWLSSDNALYRSSSIGSDFFSNYHPYAEWTWLAFNFAMHKKKIAVINKATFRINDTPNSVSKTDAYNKSYFELYERMLAANPPESIKRVIKKKIGAAYHMEATKNLVEGYRWEALKNHLQSLFYPGGYRYLMFSRKLLTGWPN